RLVPRHLRALSEKAEALGSCYVKCIVPLRYATEDALRVSEQPHPAKTPTIVWKAGVLLAWLVMAGLAFGLLVLGLKGVGKGLNAWEHSKLPSLHQAAFDGNVAECERLVKGGLSVDTTDGDGETALSWAVFNCQTDV